MLEHYIIYRPQTQQYYHSLCPRGAPLWVDTQEHAQELLGHEYLALLPLIHTYITDHAEIRKA